MELPRLVATCDEDIPLVLCFPEPVGLLARVLVLTRVHATHEILPSLWAVIASRSRCSRSASSLALLLSFSMMRLIVSSTESPFG